MKASHIPLWRVDVYLDAFPDARMKAYTSGERWNGFECPYFTMGEVRRFAKIWEAGSDDHYTLTAAYDEEMDEWAFTHSAEDEGPGGERGADMLTVDGELHLYPIGTGGWAWCKALWSRQ
jgi:hypothetical protein